MGRSLERHVEVGRNLTGGRHTEDAGDVVVAVDVKRSAEAAVDELVFEAALRRLNVDIEVEADALEELLRHRHDPHFDGNLDVLQSAERLQQFEDFFLNLHVLADDQCMPQGEVLDAAFAAGAFPGVGRDCVFNQVDEQGLDGRTRRPAGLSASAAIRHILADRGAVLQGVRPGVRHGAVVLDAAAGR